jgi:large subunit ribosomal protein L31e
MRGGIMSSDQDFSSDAVEERIYTVPLRHAWIAPVKKRTPRGVRILREFVKKHMKTDAVIISTEVNEKMWSKGIEGLPRKIRIRAVKDEDGVVTIHLVEKST